MVNDIVQRLKALATKPDDLSSFPRSHIVKDENPLLSPPHGCHGMCVCVRARVCTMCLSSVSLCLSLSLSSLIYKDDNNTYFPKRLQ